ncbi:MAG: hypothetical protein JXC32_08185, partial [Anaerolineae bacterium]|nr:hypothetical protein [Anaerolineae bacterium]
MTQDPHTLPTWAPRVRPDRVRQLYQLDAQGIYDDELIDDVGYGLLARCKSFIQAVAATQGRATCPNCGAVVEHRVDKTEMLRCHCGWSLSWSDYFATIQRQQL